MVENVVIEVPVDARVTFFEVGPAGSIEVEGELPFTVPGDGCLSAIIRRADRSLQSLPALRAGTVIQYEPRPEEPDELADYEERRIRGDALHHPNRRDGWDLRLGS